MSRSCNCLRLNPEEWEFGSAGVLAAKQVIFYKAPQFRGFNPNIDDVSLIIRPVRSVYWRK